MAAADLEAFARHAKRTTVGAEDVLLLARRKGNVVCCLWNDRSYLFPSLMVKCGIVVWHCCGAAAVLLCGLTTDTCAGGAGGDAGRC